MSEVKSWMKRGAADQGSWKGGRGGRGGELYGNARCEGREESVRIGGNYIKISPNTHKNSINGMTHRVRVRQRYEE